MASGSEHPLAIRTEERRQPREAWRQANGSARTLRYVSLLYTCFFFIEPIYHHSFTYWLWFAAFYACFLTLYFSIPSTESRVRSLLIGCLFALAFVYYPFNATACGAFVYPAVLLAFRIRRNALCVALIVATSAGILLEAWYFHLSWSSAILGAFLCVVVGLSNLAYARQQQATCMLQKAHEEIEHLAQVAERERIARDLHDLLGHTLTLITIKSELANRLLDRDPKRARKEMQDVEQTARKALEEVREAVAGYRSEGLASEMPRARQALSSAGVTLTAEIETSDIAPAVNAVLCLCIREAITNIVRHANATSCSIRLHRTCDQLTLAIVDNGSGFHGKSGSGLRGMRERIAALNGSLVIRNASPCGTSLCIEMPCLPMSITVKEIQQEAQV